MFGILKENILDNLEATYVEKGEKVFKKDFNRYIQTIKENKDLKEFYEIYDLFGQAIFESEDVAKEFVEEAVTYLKQFDKSAVSQLKQFLGDTKEKPLHEGSTSFKLDQMI